MMVVQVRSQMVSKYSFPGHGLFEKFGFTSPQQPGTLLERHFPNIYVS